MTLRALLAQYLEAQKQFITVCREFKTLGLDEEEIPEFMDKADAAEKALQSALMRAHGLDPRYTTPRPIASIVDGHLLTLVPDPNASTISERGGRAFPDSWKDGDVFAVVEPADVITAEADPGR